MTDSKYVAYEIYGYCVRESFKHWIMRDFDTAADVIKHVEANPICPKHDSPWVEVKAAGRGEPQYVKVW